MDDKNVHTDEYRREIADYIISTGRPTAQVAKEPGLNAKTASRWVLNRKNEFDGTKPTIQDSAELREAQKRIRELEMENAFLKKQRLDSTGQRNSSSS